MQLQVTNSPFNQEQADQLNRLLPTLTGPQYVWLSGYLAALGMAGVVTAPDVTGAPQSAAQAESREVTIVFGSQTGNSQRLAKSLAQRLEQSGFQINLSAMRDFKPNNLKKVHNLLVLVSTHGEGDPPDNAISFYEFLHSKRAPQLDQLRYSVLALGDTSYEHFCKTGRDFDARLAELGGQQICPRVDCDVDYDEPAAEWIENVVQGLSAASSAGIAAVASAGVAAALSTGQSAFSRTNPYRAEIIENINLNGRGSTQETRHLALSLEGSGFQFEPGDCIGIYPENNPELVQAIIEAMGWQRDEVVTVNKQGDRRPLAEALQQNFEITVLTKPLLEQASAFTANSGLKELLEQAQDLKVYMEGRDLLDFVQDFAPWNASAEQFVSILRKMPARLYSIASSYKANPEEVHLTIRALRYEANGRKRNGVCSIQTSERLQPGDTLPIYLHTNPNFKLPANQDIPIIMIGPGTGVAPFRAFVEERAEIGAEGKSWLFFGDRNFRTDFLYQTDWQGWLNEGALSRLDVAFSRDTDKKIYVQHRLLEKSKELYEWLQEGAYVYICGDEKHMARDVHEALTTIVEREGGLSRAEAESYWADLQQSARYQRDVY